jgi:hypothetical protein
VQYINITQQVPLIDLHYCKECNFWSIDEDCQCQTSKEVETVEEKPTKKSKKSTKT